MASPPKKQKNYILCHVRRVVGKKEEDEGESEKEPEELQSEVSGRGPKRSSKFAFLTRSAGERKQLKNIKLDFDLMKKMSPEDLRKAKFIQIGPDGKAKQLSAYRQKKLLQDHQAALERGEEKEIETEPILPRRGRKRKVSDAFENLYIQLASDSHLGKFLQKRQRTFEGSFSDNTPEPVDSESDKQEPAKRSSGLKPAESKPESSTNLQASTSVPDSSQFNALNLQN